MMMPNNDFDVKTDELVFEEEVSSSSLYDKSGVSDLKYCDDEIRRKRTNILIGLSVFLILLSIFAVIIGFVLMDKELKSSTGDPVKYDLFVTYGNSYGKKTITFDRFRSYESAYVYSFSVKNSNPVLLDYGVNFVDIDNFNYFNLVDYKLILNNEAVASGSLDSVNLYEMYETEIASGEVHEYVLKLWSEDIKKDVSFSFKVDINT